MEWLKSGEAILGFAISLYTIYSFVEARVRERRQRYALLKQLTSELDYFILLADSLGSRAQQVSKEYASFLAQLSFPAPASDSDTLPPAVEPAARWLVARAKRLAEYAIAMDMEKVGAILNRQQTDALFELVESRRVYVSVLMTRALDLEAFPRRPGVLKRFVAVSVVNAAPMREKLQAFASALSLPPPPHVRTAEPASHS